MEHLPDLVEQFLGFLDDVYGDKLGIKAVPVLLDVVESCVSLHSSHRRE